MYTNLAPFTQKIGLSLSENQWEQLNKYADCIWMKKDFLNLTSVSDKEEIFTRHIADGLVVAAKIQTLCQMNNLTDVTVADVGAGAGYIGFSIAVALPFTKVTLVESLEKRCSFMYWASLQSAINVQIKKARLGQNTFETYTFVTERAMGQLPDILPICMNAVSPKGFFIAFQGEFPQTQVCAPLPDTNLSGVENYNLPLQDTKKRHLVIFRKNI